MNKSYGIQLATVLAGAAMMFASVVSAADRHVSLTGASGGTLLSNRGEAEEVAWPSDFWTEFSNRVTTARNADTAVTPQYSATVAPALVAVTEGGLGTVDEPLDSMNRFWFIVDVGLFNSKFPKGTVLRFR